MNHDTSTDTTKSPRALKIFATSTVLAIAAVCLPGCTDPGFFQRSEELKAQDAALVVRLATIEAQQDATSTMLATATGEARDKLIVVSDALVAQKLLSSRRRPKSGHTRRVSKRYRRTWIRPTLRQSTPCAIQSAHYLRATHCQRA